ncbi:MAG: PBP1A family penicillin-binding protein [Epsilonproteobacteria bacterium]|nr:PBP1A family penicillin-binding protein [Campylobacterota bacterium]
MLKKILAFFLILGVIAVAAVAWYAYDLYQKTSFQADKIIKYNPPVSTKFFDRNGNLLDIRFSKENRFYAKYDEIPPRVIETLLATEDTSYFEHPGINLNAILRALVKDIKAGKKVEGASTITQQLVRNVYLNRQKTIQRKIKEIIIALKVEHMLTKEQILERYLNQIFFGHGYYGIKTAAYGYFHKPLNELTLKETAMLIALPKGPSLYDPTKHYELNLKRANWILKRMYDIGWITQKEYKKAILETPKVYQKMVNPKAQYAVDEAIKRLKKSYPDLLYGGYDVTLSIDLPTQKAAEEAIKWNYNRLLEKNKELNASKLNGALITINQQTGDVLAMVGGVDYNQSKFNRVTQSKRSVGSSIKPFVYQIALNNGFNPATQIPDISRTFKVKGKTPQEEKYWKPKNYEKNTLGLITLREALVHSRNLATINLVLELGLDKIIKGLEEFGFKNFNHDLSIALGSLGVSLWDFSKYYTIISNYGIKTYPKLILKLQKKSTNKTVVFETKHEKIEPDYQAYLIIDMMRDVVKKGTGRRAYMKEIQIAGKTGTTNDYRDAWFCGFTPNTETIIWFGNDDSATLGKGMAGGSVSAPVFKRYYTKLLEIHPELIRKFKTPKEVKKFYINGHLELFTKQSPPPKQELKEEVPLF